MPKMLLNISDIVVGCPSKTEISSLAWAKAMLKKYLECKP
jgi:hypothetical protein